MEKCIIVDLEGTISNDSHRHHFWLKKDYDSYNSLFADDVVNTDAVCKLLNILISEQDIYPILCTAKSESYKNDVKDWLSKNNLDSLFRTIHMRNSTDIRSSLEVKKSMISAIANSGIKPIYIMEDRVDIIKMAKSQFGIIPIQIQIQKNEENEKTVSTILKSALSTYESRNTEYGDSYKGFGRIMTGFFPNGLNIKTESDFTRFALFVHCIGKFDRYAKNFSNKGHMDSIIDNINYTAMLCEVDNEL